MAVYERSSLIRAPVEEVWRFHSTPEGLVAVTPGWLGLRVESVAGPAGEPAADVLEVGTTVRLSVRPMGVLPRQRWTSRITARQFDGTAGEYRDEMVDGPFPRWHHAHRFAAIRGGTRLTDRVEYELPLGPARGLSWLGWPGFEAMFGYRHHRSRRLLE